VEVEDREAVRSIEAAIHGLADKLRFPFIYCVLEGNSYEACAAILGCSIKTVDSRIYRARGKLRVALGIAN
jgi:RNA polymerase sigma-70 factor (ECF subfamily)